MNIEGSYDLYIVALSILIAIFVSYFALTITAKISHAHGKTRFFWLMASALVMGGGVWSMHFVGMLAFHLDSSVRYNGWLALFSMSSSVISAFISFYFTMSVPSKWYKIAFGGLVMGCGILTMHYVGMEAMLMPMKLSYDKSLWMISAMIAFIASYASLLLFKRFCNQPSVSWLKWISAIIMGMAICGMHYTGMAAARFEGFQIMEVAKETSVDFFLLYGVTFTIFVILFVTWGAMYFDRHVLEKMAFYDSVTGLPNRNAMNRFFETHISNETVGVLFVDLDQFKAINDTLGHNIGDKLVMEVGNRLKQFVSADRRAFRIGGDEFLFIIRPCNQEQAEQLAKQILKRIKYVYRIEGNELYVTGSIGISIGSMHDADHSTLLKEADTAMYKAKGLGKNQYCVYTEEMGITERRKMQLEKDLQCALEQHQFFIEYQPKWNVKMNCLYGFEALIRWQHPRLGTVTPAEFIPIAEETGLIIPMTRWTLEEACRQCKQWQSRGMTQSVSVNLSVRLFQTDSLIDLVQGALEKAMLQPQFLELEITETMVLHDIDEIIRQLNNIRKLGVKVSMDDFGTGYSSIGLLDRLPIDGLKLDRLFTQDLDTPSKRAIIHAIILMAEHLQLNVVAEGVENQAHIDVLTQLGCDVMQGYYYGMPMKDEFIEQWVKDDKVAQC